MIYNIGQKNDAELPMFCHRFFSQNILLHHPQVVYLLVSVVSNAFPVIVSLGSLAKNEQHQVGVLFPPLF